MKKEGTAKLESRTQELINSLRDKEKIRVLFVCLGNICRSPAAQGVFEAIVAQDGASERFVVDSAGTGNYHTGDLPDRRMLIHARQRGYDLTHRARQVRMSDFDEFDVIIAMDNNNFYDVRQLAPSLEAQEKVTTMAQFFNRGERYDYVLDPYYEGSEGFELVLNLLETSCLNLYNELR